MKSIFNFLIGIPTALFGGFIFSHMWSWFIVRKFPSLPALSILDAVGMLIAFHFLLNDLTWSLAMKEVKEDMQQKHGWDNDTWSLVSSVLRTLIFYPALLGIAYLWHLVVG